MSNIQGAMKPLMYSLADAIETDLSENIRGSQFTGSRKAVLELFEGYSPTVISSIDHSLWDTLNSVVAADQHIFGNVGVVTVVEGQQSTIHVFVYDRSKRPGSEPWDSSGRMWSRRELYNWLRYSVKAIYYRDLWSEDWKKLEDGRVLLQQYCKDRGDINYSSKQAYMKMWGNI